MKMNKLVTLGLVTLLATGPLHAGLWESVKKMFRPASALVECFEGDGYECVKAGVAEAVGATASVPVSVSIASASGMTASTGTTVSALSGAAATNATLAGVGSTGSGILGAVGISVAPAVVGAVIVTTVGAGIVYGIMSLFDDD